MLTVTLEKARNMLPELMKGTLLNSEETVIVSDYGSIVMIDQDEWNNIQETINLLKDKKSLKALMEGHQSRDEGNRPDGVSMEEAFHDV